MFGRYGRELIRILCQRQRVLVEELKTSLENGRPVSPEPWECCGDDCPNCVWNLYFIDLENYNKKIDKQYQYCVKYLSSRYKD